MPHKTLIAIVLAAATAGCMTTPQDPVDRNFGEAHRWNMAQQIENPDPNYSGEEREGANGQRAAEAVERYRDGTVKEPASVSTSSVSTGGGPN